MTHEENPRLQPFTLFRAREAGYSIRRQGSQQSQASSQMGLVGRGSCSERMRTISRDIQRTPKEGLQPLKSDRFVGRPFMRSRVPVAATRCAEACLTPGWRAPMIATPRHATDLSRSHHNCRLPDRQLPYSASPFDAAARVRFATTFLEAAPRHGGQSHSRSSPRKPRHSPSLERPHWPLRET